MPQWDLQHAGREVHLCAYGEAHSHMGECGARPLFDISYWLFQDKYLWFMFLTVFEISNRNSKIP